MAPQARYHVPAGTFHISQRQPLLMQAYLGTCVALSLYCRATGVGGIIHLLLPKPISLSSFTQPEKYASTGVPLFLQALVSKGAQRNQLIACMAGGALVGPISRQDLDLDIGGRTAETVRQILVDEQIDIGLAETGGFFTCCLSLDMATGLSTIEPAGDTSASEPVNIRRPTAAEIKKTMSQLQPIPQVALKVMRLIEDNGQGIDTVADEMRKDQVMTAQALKLANSALFAKRRPIDSLEQAIVYLGRNQMVKLILSAAVQSYFDQATSGYSLCKGGLYYHAIGCALVAEALAAKTKKVNPCKAYTAGLLHDIGKVVLDQYVAPVYPLLYRNVMENNETVLSVEKHLLGIDHTEVGRVLAEQWAFPPSLVDVVSHHHTPDCATENKPLVQIVYLADLLLSRFHIGIEFERIDTRILIDHLKDLDLAVSSFPELIDLIPPAVLDSAVYTRHHFYASQE